MRERERVVVTAIFTVDFSIPCSSYGDKNLLPLSPSFFRLYDYYFLLFLLSLFLLLYFIFLSFISFYFSHFLSFIARGKIQRESERKERERERFHLFQPSSHQWCHRSSTFFLFLSSPQFTDFLSLPSLFRSIETRKRESQRNSERKKNRNPFFSTLSFSLRE